MSLITQWPWFNWVNINVHPMIVKQHSTHQWCHLTCNLEVTCLVVGISINGNNTLIGACVTEPQISQETLDPSFPGELWITPGPTSVVFILIWLSLRRTVIEENRPQRVHAPNMYMQWGGRHVGTDREEPCQRGVTVLHCLVVLPAHIHSERPLTCRSQRTRHKHWAKELTQQVKLQ